MHELIRGNDVNYVEKSFEPHFSAKTKCNDEIVALDNDNMDF